jgi:hypothetical protein
VHNRRKRVFLLAIGFGVFVTSSILWFYRPGEDNDSGSARSTSTLDRDLLATLFGDDVPDVRITACELAARSGDRIWLPALIRRASDRDNSVRQTAWRAINEFEPAVMPALQGTGRDTQAGPDDSARSLLQFIDRVYPPPSNAPANPIICEIWADSGYVGFSPALTDACLACHAGRTRGPFTASEQCRSCHEAIYAEWAQSAHAQSLLHLHLPVQDDSSEPRPMDFGEVRGIGCLECHVVTGPAVRDGEQTPNCVHSFAGKASAGCAGCHPQTDAQWRAWNGKPQPRKAHWPPGELGLAASDDRRTCTDCHMPRVPTTTGKLHRTHRWSARRNVPLLSDGIHVRARLEPADGKNLFKAVLTNTSGHTYPTGTCRRTLEWLIESSEQPGNPVVAAKIGAAYPGHLNSEAGCTLPACGVEAGCPPHRLQPPLAPGEQREIRLPLPPAVQTVHYRLRYVRDRMNPSLYSTDIVSGTASLSPWMAGEPAASTRTSP